MRVDVNSLLVITAVKHKDTVYAHVQGADVARHEARYLTTKLKLFFDVMYVFSVQRESSVFRVFMNWDESRMIHLLLDPYALRVSLMVPWSLTSILIGRWQVSSRREFPLATGLLAYSRLARFFYLVWRDMFCGGIDRFRQSALLEAIRTAQSNP